MCVGYDGCGCTPEGCAGECDGCCGFALRREHRQFGCSDFSDDGNCFVCGKYNAEYDEAARLAHNAAQDEWEQEDEELDDPFELLDADDSRRQAEDI